jgi:hypothetical protein
LHGRLVIQHWHDACGCLWCWWLISERRVRTDGVVLIAPLLDDDPSLVQAVEDFLVEAFVAQLSVEGFAIAVLPWTARLDLERF